MAVRLGRSGPGTSTSPPSWRPRRPSACCSTTGAGRSSPWPPCRWRRPGAPGPERQTGGPAAHAGGHGPAAAGRRPLSPSGFSSSGHSEPVTTRRPTSRAGPGAPHGRPRGSAMPRRGAPRARRRRGRRSGCRRYRPVRAGHGARSGMRSHSGSWVPVPARRRLDARPGAVAPPFVGLGRVGQPDEHRTADPAIDERIDVARGLEGGRGGLVGLPPPGAGDRVLDAAGGADQHQAAEVQVGSRGHMQCHPGPQRVAEQVTRPGADGGTTASRTRSAVAGRSARTASEPACPGRSMATRVWSWASRSPKGPHRRPSG